MIKFFKAFLSLSLLLFVSYFSGCATVSTTDHPVSKVTIEKKGIYHKVKKGETLWRVAQTYNVSIEDLIRSNRIPNVAYIEPDQLIFIPGATKEKEVVVVSPDSSSSSEFFWPVKGKVVSYFGQWKNSSVNRGVDIQTKNQEPICAARDGKVVFADYLNGYAYTVILDHADGYFTVYSQNSSLLTRIGDHIKKGAPLAMAGEGSGSGLCHFEVRKKETAQNPLYYLP